MMTLHETGALYTRLAALEKQLEQLTARVNDLEAASMRYGGPAFTPGTIPQPSWPSHLPVTCTSEF